VIVGVLTWSPWKTGAPTQVQTGAANVAGGGNAQAGTGNAQAGTGDAQAGDGNIQLGDGACLVTRGGSCVIARPSEPAAQEAQDAASRKIAEDLKDLHGAGKVPTGSGPWPFMVLGTGAAKGVYVRDGVAQTNRRVQTANGPAIVAEFMTVYVDCRIDGGWVADPQVEPAGRWLKVRYPEVANEGAYYMYSGYLMPVNSNGLVPACLSA